MADIQRQATATWTGDVRNGKGTASTTSSALRDVPITFPSRFETGTGSNPEELIAAAHAACFSMQLSANLSTLGHPPQEIRTSATLTLRKDESGIKITKIHLETAGKVTGIDAETFNTAAQKAKESCPVSALLKPGLEELTLDARLSS